MQIGVHFIQFYLRKITEHCCMHSWNLPFFYLGRRMYVVSYLSLLEERALDLNCLIWADSFPVIPSTSDFVSKQRHGPVFTGRMCMNVNVCVWMCKCSSVAVWALLTSQCGKQADGFQEAVAASARPPSVTAAGAVGLVVTLRGNRAFNHRGLHSLSRSLLRSLVGDDRSH